MLTHSPHTINQTLLHSPPDSAIPTVASDVDGTLTTGQLWKGMRDYLIQHGRANAFRLFFLRRLPSIVLFRLGLIDSQPFRERWMLGMLALCKGLSEEEFDEMGKWVVEKDLWPNCRPEVVNELRLHKQNGCRVVIVTGIFEPILAHLAQKLEVEAIGTAIEFKNQRCTGQTVSGLNVGERKVAQLQPFAQDGRIKAAYGDSWRDIPMLEMSQEPVAVHPDEQLKKAAQERGWRILMG